MGEAFGECTAAEALSTAMAGPRGDRAATVRDRLGSGVPPPASRGARVIAGDLGTDSCRVMIVGDRGQSTVSTLFGFASNVGDRTLIPFPPIAPLFPCVATLGQLIAVGDDSGMGGVAELCMAGGGSGHACDIDW